MAQSIQRGNEWWNQRPDGVWLKWSSETQGWVPQPGQPPPPVAPDSPFSTAPADGGFAAVALKPGTPAVATGRQSGTETRPLPATPTTPLVSSAPPSENSAGKKANSPIFSEGRRELPPVRENKILLGVIGAILIVAAFAATYFGAKMLFDDGSSVAKAETQTPKGYSKEKWTYILEKDKVCREADLIEFNADLRERMASIESEENLIAAVDETEAKFKDMLADFQAGPMPKQDRGLLQRIFVIQNEVGPIFDQMTAAVLNKDLAAVQSIVTDTMAKGRLESKLMTRYGFQVCGRMPF